MNIVLYTQQFEAITVVDLSIDAIREFEKYESYSWRMAAMKPLRLCPPEEPIRTDECGYWVVTITSERIVRHGKHHLLFFVDNDEFALALKSGCLPGQQKEYNERFRKGFVQGAYDTIQQLKGYDNGKT